MGRNPKYNRASIAAAALELVAEGGPQAATMAAIAGRLGAPTGSIYHRYRSRDLLLAELWMSVVEEYQNGVVAVLQSTSTSTSTSASANEGAAAVEVAVQVARFMPEWVREHLLEARLLLLHHRRDFVSGSWPAELVRRAEALEKQLGASLRGFCRQSSGAATKTALAKARFALLDAPYAAVKPYVQAGKVPPPVVDELLEKTARAIIE